MQLSIFAILIVSLLSLSMAYLVQVDPESLDEYYDENAALDTFRNVKRQVIRPSACMPWSLPCLPDTKFKFAQCCEGYVCACNIWKTVCKCRSRLG